MKYGNLVVACAAIVLAGTSIGQQTESVRIPRPDAASPTGHFGRRVAIDPPWAAISDYPVTAGVFLYERLSTGWHLSQGIIEQSSSSFGEAMAIDGTTMVIGAETWDFVGERKGKAFVYEYDGSQWRRTQELQPAGLRPNDRFGAAVGLNGDVLVVGAPSVSTPGFAHGAVFIYEKNGTSWQIINLFRYESDSVHPLTGLGESVAVSGRTVVAGAPAAGLLEGAAWVFEREDTDWRHTAVLADPTPTVGDHFGNSVSIWGDTIVVGEIAGQGIGGLQTKKGSAFIFERGPGDTWTLMQEIEASDGWSSSSAADLFGAHVAVEADKVVVATPHAITAGLGNGGVYLFQRSEEGSWPQHETERYVVSDTTISPNGVGLGESMGFRDGFILAGALPPKSGYVFEVESGFAFCDPAANSSGESAHLAAVISPDSDVVLSVHNAPQSQPGAFFVSPTRDEIVFQPSSLCLGAGLWRLDPVSPTGPGGAAMHNLQQSTFPGLGTVTTWYFQYWFADSQAGAGSSNLSNAVALPPQ